MTNSSEHKYTMTVSLHVLEHLGIGLYSNNPAVLSEAIANAWDADAKNVDIRLDIQNQKVTIQDDGHGMTVDDANDKYLTVGYKRRRESSTATTPGGRDVMGRKGIGKLSLFSIADTVEVHSVKDNERHGFRMNSADIEQAIDSEGDYHPDPIDSQGIDLEKGTLITLTGMKRHLYRRQTGDALKRRLARRFSVIGGKDDFTIKLDGEVISVSDRGYHDKLQYIWTFGEKGKEIANIAKNTEHSRKLASNVTLDGKDAVIDGWIGTVRKPSELKDNGENINGIVIMVRGKLAQENILDDFGDQNLYSEYVIGEVHADFLDQDDKKDIATTSRQRLIEEDPRYQGLRQTLAGHLKTIQSQWRKYRDKGGPEIATAIPQINEWYKSLGHDQKINAQKLFGRINQLAINEDSEKRRIFIGAILAFESLKFRDMLSRLDSISTENIGALAEVFELLDDIEQSAYYQITRERIDVIRTLTNLVDVNAKEKALQEHLYNHLWLLDPSWERATRGTEVMESRIYNALGIAYESFSDEAKKSRLDIYYRTAGNKHVIIELKRADRKLHFGEIYDQIEMYYTQTITALDSLGQKDAPLEIICILGQRPYEWDNALSNPEQRNREALKSSEARIVMYDELIQNALEAYQDYADKSEDAGRVYRLIRSIEEEDASAMHPSSSSSD